jgi:hypothetical protein
VAITAARIDCDTNGDEESDRESGESNDGDHDDRQRRSTLSIASANPGRVASCPVRLSDGSAPRIGLGAASARREGHATAQSHARTGYVARASRSCTSDRLSRTRSRSYSRDCSRACSREGEMSRAHSKAPSGRRLPSQCRVGAVDGRRPPPGPAPRAGPGGAPAAGSTVTRRQPVRTGALGPPPPSRRHGGHRVHCGGVAGRGPGVKLKPSPHARPRDHGHGICGRPPGVMGVAE